MRLIILPICFALIITCVTPQSAASQNGKQSSGISVPETDLRSLADLRKAETASGSEQLEAATTYISRYAIPLDQPELYLREDPLLPGVPLVVLYFPATNDGAVRKLQYEWGDQEGKPYWVQQPLENLEVFKERYEALYDRLTAAFGKPIERTSLNAITMGDIKTWRQGDTWANGDAKAELALSFSEPVPEGGNRGSGIVRYKEVHRIRLTITHGL